MLEILALENYGEFITAAWGAAFIIMLAITVSSIAKYRRTQKQLKDPDKHNETNHKKIQR